MLKWLHYFILVFSFAILTSHSANAAENVRIGGFVRAAGAASDSSEDYMERINSRGNFGDTHFGITASATIDKRWSVAGQIFGSGAEENYAMIVDWAYGTYRAYEEVSVNLGKMKYPNLIVSEYYDIGITYPWIRPPEELYRIEVVGPSFSYEAFTGAKLNYENSVGDMDVAFSVYGGGTALETETMTNMGGAVLSLGTESFSVRAAYNRSRLVLSRDSLGNNLSEREGEMDGKTQSVMSFGLNFDISDFIGYAEFASAEVDGVDEVSTDASYFTLGYRIGKFTPHITVAQFEAENKLGQESLTYGVKYQINPSSSFKVEFKTIEPTERVDEEPDENPAGFFEDAPDDAEVSVFSIAYDVVF